MRAIMSKELREILRHPEGCKAVKNILNPVAENKCEELLVGKRRYRVSVINRDNIN